MDDNKYYLPWNFDTLVWGTTDYIWSEVYIVTQIAAASGGGIRLPLSDTWNELDKNLAKKKITEEQRKVFLRVVARVNGLVKTEEKSVDTELKKVITINHIKNTFQEFGHKIQVTVKKVKKQ